MTRWYIKINHLGGLDFRAPCCLSFFDSEKQNIFCNEKTKRSDGWPCCVCLMAHQGNQLTNCCRADEERRSPIEPTASYAPRLARDASPPEYSVANPAIGFAAGNQSIAQGVLAPDARNMPDRIRASRTVKTATPLANAGRSTSRPNHPHNFIQSSDFNRYYFVDAI